MTVYSNPMHDSTSRSNFRRIRHSIIKRKLTRFVLLCLILISILILSIAFVHKFNWKVHNHPRLINNTSLPVDPVTTLSTNSNAIYLHYIHFRNDESVSYFHFSAYLSVLSAIQRLKPDEIFIHGNKEPTGDWWITLRDQQLVRYLPIQKVTHVGWWQNASKPVAHHEHSADIAKLDAILQYGGIVADFDVYFIRGERLKDLVRQGLSITCYGNKEGYNMGLLAGPKTAKFLWAWRRSYTDTYTPDWNFNSGFMPKFLSHLFPKEVYVLNNTCNNPHPFNLKVFFTEFGKINWKDSLAIHSYSRFGGVAMNSPEDLRSGNLTDYKDMLKTIYENRPLPPINLNPYERVSLIHDFEP